MRNDSCENFSPEIEMSSYWMKFSISGCNRICQIDDMYYWPSVWWNHTPIGPLCGVTIDLHIMNLTHWPFGKVTAVISHYWNQCWPSSLGHIYEKKMCVRYWIPIFQGQTSFSWQQICYPYMNVMSCGYGTSTHCGLVTSYCDRDLGQHWLR